jgi:serine/threonine protein kinase
VILEYGKACITGNKSLLKYVVEEAIIGYGSFGSVYKVDLPDNKASVAIKEGRISKDELKKAKDKKYPLEYLFNKLVNDLIDDKICPNFAYTYLIYFCDKCFVTDWMKRTINTQCSETVVELFDFTLEKLNDTRDEVILSILFQLLFAVAAIQLKYGMVHADIKAENVLIKVIPPGGYWEYNVMGKKYVVPNHGYIVALNDFGSAAVVKPGFSEKNYGRRQAEVVYDDVKNSYYFRPFSTKFKPVIGKNEKVISSQKALGENQFYKDFDSRPSRPVDLEDMGRFPEQYFNYDIVDTIFTFIGGKRTMLPLYHPKLRISKTIRDLLKNYYVVPPQQKWPRERVDLFLANHTIMKLFSFYLENYQNYGPKIDSYNL